MEDARADGADGRAIGAVGEVDHQAHDIVHRAAGRFDNRAHVFEALLRLGLGIALADEVAVGVARDLAGDPDDVVRADAVGVGELGRRGVVELGRSDLLAARPRVAFCSRYRSWRSSLLANLR